MAAINIVRKFFPGVTEVSDATRKEFIEVTNADASSKAVKDHNACAMAVAAKRQFKLDGVIISRSVAYLIKGRKATRYKMTETASREVTSFDRGAGFAAGKYELAKPDPSNRLGSRVGRKLKLDRSRDVKEPQFRHITTNVRSVLGGQAPEGE